MADLPYAKKSLGQHWLTDKSALESIADSVKLEPDTVVLEIGPGVGTLTELLIQKVSTVIAVEYDAKLAQELTNTLGNPTNLSVIQQDILEFDLTKLPSGYVVIANIPYYLTSKLVRMLCESSNPPKYAALLVQKEVAQRLAAEPGGMSLLSLSAQVYYKVSLGDIVPAHLFTPPPKVDSQVVVLERLAQPLIAKDDRNIFFKVVKAGFSERRKKLRSSLSGGLRISKPEADNLLLESGLKPDSRAQELSIDDWIKLSQNYKH